MKALKSTRERVADVFYWFLRISALLSVVFIFFPAFNPARVCSIVNENLSLFTSAISWDSLTADVAMNFRLGIVTRSSFQYLMMGSIIALAGIIVMAVGACTSLGNLKMKKFGLFFSGVGSLAMLAGLYIIYAQAYGRIYNRVSGTGNFDSIAPSIPYGFWVFGAFAAIVFVLTLLNAVILPKAEKGSKMEMATPYKLFLIMLPFLLLVFVFSYLPLYGWRYALFDYRAGQTLSFDKFVGWKWFKYFFVDQQTRKDVLIVLRNTLVMSGLGILTSWVPIAFAIFLNEVKAKWFRRIVQVFTTIPNFVSWVMIYSIAFAIFSTDGFYNTIVGTSVNYLEEGVQFTWIKMLLWGMWKSVGWSAIIYIAGISGIAPELYEAATVDGAGRAQKMWHITVPGLIPTYCVLLLMSIANVLSNGMDQYLMFYNYANKDYINVLDLYVYKLGLENGSIPLSTVVSMTKSVVSIILLFAANGVSKAIRGESIV